MPVLERVALHIRLNPGEMIALALPVATAAPTSRPRTFVADAQLFHQLSRRHPTDVTQLAGQNAGQNRTPEHCKALV
jgi:hypothetical protein